MVAVSHGCEVREGISDVREGGREEEGGGERVVDTMIEFVEQQSMCCKLYLVWCIGSGFSSFTTNLASVHAIHMYFHVACTTTL